jgi:hypothetical protein
MKLGQREFTHRPRGGCVGTHDPKLRSIVRNVRLVNCEQQGCSVHRAVVEDGLVDGLWTSGLFQAFGAVYKHVVICGNIGRIMLTSAVPRLSESWEDLRPLEQANTDYYTTVDWALDISEAQAEEIDIRGIPARLIRRDPETQVVITRERAMRGAGAKNSPIPTGVTGLRYFLVKGNRMP